MDPSEKNQYNFFYTRRSSVPQFRSIGLFSLMLLFLAIPAVMLLVRQQTNNNSHAAYIEASPSPILSQAESTQITEAPTDILLMDATTATKSSTPTETYASIGIINAALGTSSGNIKLLHPTRQITITLKNLATKKTYTEKGEVTFDGNKSFTNAHILLGTIPTGTYQILIALPGTLQKFLVQANGSNTFRIKTGTPIVIPPLTVIPGDIAPIPNSNEPYGDNILDISDYNQLVSCYKTIQLASCTDRDKLASDLNDDGNINEIDYNILLRSFATRDGDSLTTATATPTMPISPTNTISQEITPTQTTTITPSEELSATPTP